MDGTVLITGANSSLAIPAIEYLLSKYPNYNAVLTVRDTSEADLNTRKLRQIIEAHPGSTVTVEKLDLASLAAVASFADLVNSNISEGKWPRLSALVCNAFFWSLAGGPQFSKDGFELSLAVAHISHMSLALRLLNSFSTSEGRVVFLGSEVHWPGRNAPMEQFPPGITDDLEQMVHPPPDKKGEEAGRGFQRYGIAKLAVIMGMYELNKRLKDVSNKPRDLHASCRRILFELNWILVSEAVPHRSSCFGPGCPSRLPGVQAG
jgi:NAD(P)-dependent dehydrogenase (short-subunit alcohol dehydrogenase family)